MAAHWHELLAPYNKYEVPEAVLAIMIPTYTTSVGLPKICLAFDWSTQMKIPRTDPDEVIHGSLKKGQLEYSRCVQHSTATLDYRGQSDDCTAFMRSVL